MLTYKQTLKAERLQRAHGQTRRGAMEDKVNEVVGGDAVRPYFSGRSTRPMPPESEPDEQETAQPVFDGSRWTWVSAKPKKKAK